MAMARFRYPSRLVNPPPTSAATSHVMRANRARDTRPELDLRRSLWRAGLRGYRLHKRDIPGRPDLAYPSHKLAIFVNGCFWHACPRCRMPLPRSHSGFWKKKFDRNRERDRRKERELRERGWKVLTIWECELRRSVERCVARVRSAFPKLRVVPRASR